MGSLAQYTSKKRYYEKNKEEISIKSRINKAKKKIKELEEKLKNLKKNVK